MIVGKMHNIEGYTRIWVEHGLWYKGRELKNQECGICILDFVKIAFGMPIFTVFIFFLYNGCDFDSCKP
jgi:hypothetical protein